MRTIKFRGWDKEDQAMVYKINSLRLFDGELKPDEYILMQFTGLHDSRGKEIYEGDILQGYDWNDDYSAQNVPAYKYDISTALESSCGCCTKVYGWVIKDPSEEKIIGNVFESPELLEVAS